MNEYQREAREYKVSIAQGAAKRQATLTTTKVHYMQGRSAVDYSLLPTLTRRQRHIQKKRERRSTRAGAEEAGATEPEGAATSAKGSRHGAACGRGIRVGGRHSPAGEPLQTPSGPPPDPLRTPPDSDCTKLHPTFKTISRFNPETAPC
eukprot:1195440-Prorocentrum_minimum.AAC.15